MPGLFDPLELRGETLRNRIAVSPMCQYSCEAEDGLATDWHHVHLGSRAVGGAGLVITEATAVEPRGVISPKDLGIWSDEHGDALADTAEFITRNGATAGIQLAHAGRKALTLGQSYEGESVHQPEDWTPIGPTETPYPSDNPLEVEALDREGIEEVKASFRTAAERALAAGFDVVEIHGAHGYLLHEFYSPITNTRDDEYGGDFEGRTRLVREVTREVREVWPDEKPVLVRLSATDWMGEDGWTVEDTARLTPLLADAGADLLDISAGGIHPDQEVPTTGPHYQVPLAERVTEALAGRDCVVGAVGGITTPEGAEEVVRNGHADAVLLGREHLRDPYFALHAAKALNETPPTPRQYKRVF